MKKRLILFLKHLGIGQLAFEENVGFSRGYVNKIGDNITLKSLDKIEAAYPELNLNWLKTGEGEMLKAEDTNISNDKTTLDSNETNILFIDFLKEKVGYLEGYVERLRDQILELSKNAAVLENTNATLELSIKQLKRVNADLESELKEAKKQGDSFAS